MLNKSMADITKVSKMKGTKEGGVGPPPPKYTAFPPVYGYMYTSAPKAVGGAGSRQPTSKRPLKKSDRGLIPGEYFNLMFDPRVYRGSNFQTFQETERNRCKKTAQQLEKREVLRQIKRFRGAEYTLGGIVRPKTPQEKHRNSDRVATRLFLTEHVMPIAQNHQMVQTDEKQQMPLQNHLQLKTGVDCTVGTQTEPWELFDFEEEVSAIAPIMSEKIIEQSLQEVMEEIELQFARGVWVTAHQKLHVAQSHLELMKTNEKEFCLKAAARRLEIFEEDILSKELEHLVGIICVTQSYLSQLPTNTLSSIMRADGSLSDTTFAALKAEFQPWLSLEVRKECYRNKITSLIINDVIITVVKQRASAVLGDLGLEIDFTGSQDDLTNICPQRVLLMSDSNASSEYKVDFGDPVVDSHSLKGSESMSIIEM